MDNRRRITHITDSPDAVEGDGDGGGGMAYPRPPPPGLSTGGTTEHGDYVDCNVSTSHVYQVYMTCIDYLGTTKQHYHEKLHIYCTLHTPASLHPCTVGYPGKLCLPLLPVAYRPYLATLIQPPPLYNIHVT